MGDYTTKEEGLDLGNAKATLILAGVFMVILGYKFFRTHGMRRTSKKGN